MMPSALKMVTVTFAVGSTLFIALTPFAAAQERTSGYSPKGVKGQYLLVMAARYCADTVGVFTEADIAEINAFAKQIVDESGLDREVLDQVWQETKAEFDGVRALALDTSFASRKQYCERMSMLRVMLLPPNQSPNPFTSGN